MEPPNRRRVIIDTDAKNEADDQFAIVHALLSPSLDVRGLIAAHFGTSRSDRSMQESREEIDLLLDLMGLEGEVTVANGAPAPISDEQTPRESEGTDRVSLTGDSPAISLMLYPRGGNFRIVPAPRFGQEGHYLPGSGHPIRVVESVDVRFLLEDMFAKIRKFGREAA
jgi:hypothetical protein